MKTRITSVVGALAMLALAPAAVLSAERADAQQKVDKAQATFERFVSDPEMGWFRNHIGDAQALLIVPEQVKGGFILGGSGGSGVLLGRGPRNDWSYPAFYNMGGASIGLQIGAQVSEVVLMIMTERGMDAMYSTEFKLGGDVSVAAGPVGAGASAATADVLAFARSKGVFGGVSLEGSVIGSEDELNSAYYGRSVRALDIVERRSVSNRGADGLRRAVARAAGGRASVPQRSAPRAAPADYDLAAIQRRLKALGFDPGPVDGLFGPKTSRAISSYQSARGETVTGRPSKALQESLER